MRVWVSGLLMVVLVLLVVAGVALTPRGPARAASPATAPRARHAPAPAVVRGEQAGEARQQQPLCCCRYLVQQRWQTGWMTPAACAQVSGSCVTPDHC